MSNKNSKNQQHQHCLLACSLAGWVIWLRAPLSLLPHGLALFVLFFLNFWAFDLFFFVKSSTNKVYFANYLDARSLAVDLSNHNDEINFGLMLRKSLAFASDGGGRERARFKSLDFNFNFKSNHINNSQKIFQIIMLILNERIMIETTTTTTIWTKSRTAKFQMRISKQRWWGYYIIEMFAFGGYYEHKEEREKKWLLDGLVGR